MSIPFAARGTAFRGCWSCWAGMGSEASFFFSVGPDNMGRHLWRLIKTRSFCGRCCVPEPPRCTAGIFCWPAPHWPGRRIGAGNEAVLRAAAESHEVGLHAWDHYSWQAWSGVWPQERLALEVERGLLELERIIGRPVTCSAVAGWRADQRVVKAKESFDFLYNSDCRGTRPFLPQLGSGVSGTVQIPVTLPTWDEAVGTAVDIAGFNRYLLDCIHRDAGVPVYTIHAEVEGIAYADQFNELLTMAAEEEIQFCPLSQLLPADFSELPSGKVVRGELAGREGWLGREQLLTSGV
ncbi:4-deoxy-4-formamido-L-arabinose-phosphoundecaprenol deformylase [Klebsiella pneumoniae]|nr:4-deoxy-4-formamido-L-arabinose-phosphoundecaprenol deformylase [Klebsiella pneumoniae]